ncbi:hypothetical protein LAZ40_09150 [Cereibacter sphaeroides]|uniref:hypothetical protein n=1 Tax=Cereibacter sphaeroides TaxID=1063 RepID=UPI001F34A9EE|nr:hypothetical protein [Cereibacter sphaeroides]MCE6959217.1 hypothetical protein [Cereibacter sphaeroides]MCE6972020.1 hypothetical protein [Cereibacter sphaeroides]
MPVTLPQAFPILEATTRQPGKLLEAIRMFRDGLAAGAIRNKDYETAKSTLSRSLQRALEATVNEPFFHAGRWAQQTKEVQDLHAKCSFYSLHDLLASSRRLAASSLDGPSVRALRAIVEEALPLAHASAELKGMVVKGRAPVAEPARPVNPDQVRGTCSCCFRDIAVVPTGKMAHHGYERPGYGTQTSSCAGIRFKPLEVSLEGLEWLIWSVSEEIGKIRERLARKDEMTVIHYDGHERGRLVPKRIERHEEGWDRVFRAWTRSTEAALGNTERHLADLETRLEDWRARTPAPAGDDTPGP